MPFPVLTLALTRFSFGHEDGVVGGAVLGFVGREVVGVDEAGLFVASDCSLVSLMGVDHHNIGNLVVEELIGKHTNYRCADALPEQRRFTEENVDTPVGWANR
jgi:hypothetical protein